MAYKYTEEEREEIYNARIRASKEVRSIEIPHLRMIITPGPCVYGCRLGFDGWIAVDNCPVGHKTGEKS